MIQYLLGFTSWASLVAFIVILTLNLAGAATIPWHIAVAVLLSPVALWFIIVVIAFMAESMR